MENQEIEVWSKYIMDKILPKFQGKFINDQTRREIFNLLYQELLNLGIASTEIDINCSEEYQLGKINFQITPKTEYARQLILEVNDRIKNG